MTIFDIANLIYEMGYSPVPLIEGEKRPYAMVWQKRAADRDRALWNEDGHMDCNIGIYCGEFVIIIDGDAKDEAGIGVTGKQVVDWLWAHHPEAFVGTIREITAGRGSHTTYRWTADAVEFPWSNTLGKTYCAFTHEDCDIIPEGVECHIELLTRNAQAVCPPSIVKGNPYVYVSEQTHMNTPRGLLPELPEVFRKANHRFVEAKVKKEEEARKLAEKAAEERKKGKTQDMLDVEDRLNVNDMEVQREALVQSYARTAGIGARHKNALGLARTLFGHGYSYSDVEHSVRDFFRCVSSEDRVQGAVGSDKEINDIVDDAQKNPDKDPPCPWKAINRERKNRMMKQIKLLDDIEHFEESEETIEETSKKLADKQLESEETIKKGKWNI